MFTALCRHAYSDWQNTEVFSYVIGMSKHGHNIIVLTFKENTISIFLLYICTRNTYQQKGANS